MGGIRTRATLVALLAAVALVAGACGERVPAKRSYRSFGAGSMVVQDVVLDAVETVQDIGNGTKYHVWTFGGTAPGPVIRVTEGDTVRFTLNNKSSLSLSHSIDFHAAQTPWDKNYQPVAPGKSFTFEWVARFPGVFMYHCGVPPVLHHIANGMYGAIIVEPKEALPAAREYVLVNSEFYGGSVVKGVTEGAVARMTGARPTHVVWNGVAGQYATTPLEAKPDELIRLWVMNAGPTLTSAFHVIGALFDHVYPDGNPTTPQNGLQTYNVPPGGGAMFEMRIPDEGLYPFVTHAFAYTGLGSVGVLKVSKDAAARPASYPLMASPFDGGLRKVAGTVAGKAPPAPVTEEPSPAPASGETTTITAKDVKFSPTSVNVVEGSTVEFVNADGFAHDITIDILKLKVLANANETKRFTIQAKPGTYDFYCSIPGHKESGMVGKMTVLPGAAH